MTMINMQRWTSMVSTALPEVRPSAVADAHIGLGLPGVGAASHHAHAGVVELVAAGALGPRIRTVGDEFNLNGALPVHRATSAAGAGVDVLLKSNARGEAARELFAHDVAGALGMQRLLPAMARRDDLGGDIAMEVVPGTTVLQHQAYDEPSLRSAMIAANRGAQSGGDVTMQEATRQAGIDLDLMHAFDYLTANADRHANNAMLDAATGRFTLIDHGRIGARPIGADGLRPRLLQNFLIERASPGSDAGGYIGRTQTVQIGDDARSVLASADRTALRAAIDQFRSEAPVAFRSDEPLLEAQYFDGLERRLDQLATTGQITFRA